jgi:hypothetical protein
MVSLERGFYEFHFDSFDDMRLACSSGTVNLKPGVYCGYQNGQMILIPTQGKHMRRFGYG